jgi:phosphoribosylanthranilate isomerase
MCVLAGVNNALRCHCVCWRVPHMHFKHEYMCAGGLQNHQVARVKDKNKATGTDVCADG